MQIQANERDGIRFLECAEPITQMSDALELVTASVENESNLLLLDGARLPEEFFDLSSGFAGEFLLKMQNYRIRVAAVFPADREYSDNFNKFLSEARRSTTFRAFDDRPAAEDWLLAE